MEPNAQKYQLTQQQIDELLNRTFVGSVSTIGTDGYPYTVPVNYVWMDGAIYFHGRFKGEKLSNIAECPNVCFTVWDEKGYEDCGKDSCDTTVVYECVVIRGKAEKIEDVDLKAKMLQALVDKIVPDKKNMDMRKVPPTAVCKIIPESITGKYHNPAPGNRVREC